MKAFEKIDKIIYPHDNGTAPWWKRTRWDVVCGSTTFFFYKIEVIKMLETLMYLNEEALERKHG